MENGSADERKAIVIATRGSALALVQARWVQDRCRSLYPEFDVRLEVIKTTGDKLQLASLAKPEAGLPKGLFTKEIESALLEGHADLAVHSLKDLPTDLPEGLILGGVTEREDVRDVMILRGKAPIVHDPQSPQPDEPLLRLRDLPEAICIATSSTRRQAQVRRLRPDVPLVEIRGNVATRLRKLADSTEIDGTLLASAGLRRLGIRLLPTGEVVGDDLPGGLFGGHLSALEVLPCVGQAALGLEIRQGDAFLQSVCDRLSHAETRQSVLAERAFLHALGGGCQSPVGALGQVTGDTLLLKGITFTGDSPREGEQSGEACQPEGIGKALARELLGPLA